MRFRTLSIFVPVILFGLFGCTETKVPDESATIELRASCVSAALLIGEDGSEESRISEECGCAVDAFNKIDYVEDSDRQELLSAFLEINMAGQRNAKRTKAAIGGKKNQTGIAYFQAASRKCQLNAFIW